MSEAFTVKAVPWASASEAIRKIRDCVFVQEQSVPLELEWDECDESAIHFLLYKRQETEAIGTARLLATGQIGRIAVLSPYRRLGGGQVLLKAAISESIKRDYPRVFMHAQEYLVPWYAREGFVCEGGIFEEAGIPHQAMYLQLDKDYSL